MLGTKCWESVKKCWEGDKKSWLGRPKRLKKKLGNRGLKNVGKEKNVGKWGFEKCWEVI